MKILGMTKTQNRGDIILVEYQDGDYFFRTGDLIFYNDNTWFVVDIELSKKLIDPPILDSKVGLVVKKKMV